MPVFLMMPLDTVDEEGKLKQYAVDCLAGAKEVGAEGIMVPPPNQNPSLNPGTSRDIPLEPPVPPGWR